MLLDAPFFMRPLWAVKMRPCLVRLDKQGASRLQRRIWQARIKRRLAVVIPVFVV
jgi:hypothetical protein